MRPKGWTQRRIVSNPAEVFFNIAIAYYPELLLRLDCFVVCLSFAETSDTLISKMSSIIEACNEVLFAMKLFLICLSVGLGDFKRCAG